MCIRGTYISVQHTSEENFMFWYIWHVVTHTHELLCSQTSSFTKALIPWCVFKSLNETLKFKYHTAHPASPQEGRRERAIFNFCCTLKSKWVLKLQSAMFRPLHPAFQRFYSDPCMLSPPQKKDVACMTKKKWWNAGFDTFKRDEKCWAKLGRLIDIDGNKLEPKWCYFLCLKKAH